MRYLAILLSVILIFPPGCVTTEKSPTEELQTDKTVTDETQTDQTAKETRRLVFLPITVEAYEWPENGQLLRKAEWDPAIRETILNTFKEKFSSEGARFKTISEDSFSEDQKENLRETLALWMWQVIEKSERLWGRRKTFFTPKPVEFNVGKEIGQLDPEADLFLLVFSSQVISAKDRKDARFVRNTGTIIVSLPLAALLALGGVPPVGGPKLEKGGLMTIIVGLVDAKTGKIIWYGTAKGEEVDLRDPEELRDRLFHLFRTFPWDEYQFK